MSADISLHSTLEAIVRHHADPMSSAEAASCLGCTLYTVSEGVRLGRIEGTKLNVRGHGQKNRVFVTKAALITFIWNAESGDRETLRSAMQQLCPKLLKTLEAREKPSAARPKNIVLHPAHPEFDFSAIKSA